MAFPTANVTPGSGLLINTLPNAGQATMSNSLSVAVASDQSNIPIISGPSITNPTSVLTRPVALPAGGAYAAGQLIASSATAGSVVVPSFAIAGTAGGAICSRVRFATNVASWGGVSLSVSVNLWTAAPTFNNGDGGAYSLASGHAGWLGNFQITLFNGGTGAYGAGVVTGANEIAVRLASGTSIFWDLSVNGAIAPTSGQTFTLIPELIN